MEWAQNLQHGRNWTREAQVEAERTQEEDQGGIRESQDPEPRVSSEPLRKGLFEGVPFSNLKER